MQAGDRRCGRVYDVGHEAQTTTAGDNSTRLPSTVSETLAWRDLNRRSPAEVRGRTRFWRVVIALNPENSLLYWLFGRS